ncbi:ABC transporter permease [Telmatospirillum siberiense]|nr:ABC transporter permease [Telmatospirillum siberiense]
MTARRGRRLSVSLGIAGTTLFFIGWEALSRSGLVNTVMLPAPTTVIQAAWALSTSGQLLFHLVASLWRSAAGFATGGALGVLLGLTMARLPRFSDTIYPLVQMARAIPALAFVPLAVFWFGIGEGSKIFLIAWGVFFPTWVNTFIGVRDANELLIRAGASLGARGWRMTAFVIIPSALPFIIAGLRISLAVALMILVAAELTGAVFGVGYLIQMSQMVFRVDQMFVGLVVLGVLGFASDLLFNRIVALLLPWYGAERTRETSS